MAAPADNIHVDPRRQSGIKKQGSKIRNRLYLAGAVRDAAGVRASPGAVAVDPGSRVLAAGPVMEVERAAGPDAERIHLPDHLLIPGLVNAHAHLDLTDLGYRPYGGDFIEWVKMVMAERPKASEAVEAAVRDGLAMSRMAGVCTLGDIAGSMEAITARLRADPQRRARGTSYLECFGFGERGRKRTEAARDELDTILQREAAPDIGIRCELQPHAPYSAGREVYEVAHNYLLGFPSTHLAETPEELQFVRDASGPFADLLKEWGAWDPSIRPTGLTPVEYLADELAQGGWLLAHCNYMSDEDVDRLAGLSTEASVAPPSVAYCPRASEYFGHRGHRYRDMMEAGVNVCLGTDSILCTGSMSILDEMRRLYQRDGTDPGLLLKMATVNGMRGLFMDAKEATFAAGVSPGVVAIRYDDRFDQDPLAAALGSPDPTEVRMLEGTEN